MYGSLLPVGVCAGTSVDHERKRADRSRHMVVFS